MPDPTVNLVDEALTEAVGDWGDTASDSSRYDQGQPVAVPSLRGDRSRGQCSPIFENEIDLAWYRGASRALEALSAMANGAILDNLSGYTFGYGWTYSVEPIASADPPDGLVQACQRLVDDTLKANEWTERQAEWDRIVRVDGDMAAAVHFPKSAGGVPTFREVHAEFITEPGDIRRIEETLAIQHREWCHAFGVLTASGDQSNPIGLHVQWDDADDRDFYPIVDSRNPARAVQLARAMGTAAAVWYKRNTRRNVKRGLPDFFPLIREIFLDKKLARNVAHGAALQSAIAWIEQYQQGVTQSQIQADAAANRSGQRVVTRDGSPVQRGERSIPPGSTLKVPYGKQYQPGPMGAERNAGFGEAAQLVARRIGLRWNMPEFMISGDASNANYSSTLVAESPFTKARQRDQQWHVSREERLLWTVLAWGCEVGRFSRFGVGSLRDLQRAVALNITTSEVESSDRLQDAQIKDIERRNGVISVQTWRQSAGYDHKAEEQYLADEAGIETPMDQTDRAAATDQTATPKPAEPQRGDNAALDAATPDLRLNGAQLAAARETLADIVNRRILPSVGEALLVALGLAPDVARKMTQDTQAAADQGLLKTEAEVEADAVAATADATDKPLDRQAVESVRTSVCQDVIRQLWEAYP